jgi:hypothetical protein
MIIGSAISAEKGWDLIKNIREGQTFLLERRRNEPYSKVNSRVGDLTV